MRCINDLQSSFCYSLQSVNWYMILTLIMFITIILIITLFASWDIAVGNVKKVMDKNPAKQISTVVENMLKTGRLVTQTGLDLQQVLTCQGLVYLCHICLYLPAANCLFVSLNVINSNSLHYM